MPGFKPKSNKKIRVCKKYINTLDGKHNEFTNEFFKNEIDIIPKLKEERNLLKIQIDILETNFNSIFKNHKYTIYDIEEPILNKYYGVINIVKINF